MKTLDEQAKRISTIFRNEIPKANEKSLRLYLAYLKEHLELLCQVTGIEDFDWEEYYVIGPGSKIEYEKLKRTQPSFTDKFTLIMFDNEIDEQVGILVHVQRVSDKKKFTLPLAELKATDKRSKNYQLLDDYSVWFVNS